MASELADLIDGTPGRFVPEEMRGELVEAEHLTRYWWASPLAKRGRVLDAGCGLGYGTVTLADAGASEAVGVDLAPEVVEAARASAGDRARFEVADVRELPFEDASFDVVVCFEVIEHVSAQDRALDELRRVLAADGILAISSPNPDVYVQGNPHHVRELRPGELRELLAARFADVRVFHQTNHIASTVLTGGDAGCTIRRVSQDTLEGTVYSLALAGAAPLPELPDQVSIAAPIEVREWMERFDAQQDHIAAQAAALDTYRRRLEAQAELTARLAELENEAAEMPAMRARMGELVERTADLADELDRARATVRNLESSLSWRLTAPLRSLKQRSRRSSS